MNKIAKDGLITINCGSSSIKFALYEFESSLSLLFSGEMVGIGSASTKGSFTKSKNKQNPHNLLKIKDYTKAGQWLVTWLLKEIDHVQIKVVGHRIVQGMEPTAPEKITDSLLNDLKAISAYDPEHLPAEISLIEVFKKQFPEIDQIACYDTYFHKNMILQN